MQITLLELLNEVKDYLLTTREIVITTNLITIILVGACIGYLLFAYFKSINKGKRKPPKKELYNYYWDNKKQWWVKYDKNAYGPYNKPDNEPKWYPTGWYWDEIDCCWKPPEYKE